MNQFEDIQIVLGSKSPRRQQLLSEAGFKFEIRTNDTDESFSEDMHSLEVAEYLARKKADALYPTLLGNEIIITADSVVILDDRIYNKPKNHAISQEMLRQLSGREHCVATGVCLVSRHKCTSFTTLTYVTFDRISDDEINYYITNYQPFDKAGSYGIQDWIGLCKVNGIRGSYSNVMGLPVRDVYNALLEYYNY